MPRSARRSGIGNGAQRRIEALFVGELARNGRSFATAAMAEVLGARGDLQAKMRGAAGRSASRQIRCFQETRR